MFDAASSKNFCIMVVIYLFLDLRLVKMLKVKYTHKREKRRAHKKFDINSKSSLTSAMNNKWR